DMRPTRLRSAYWHRSFILLVLLHNREGQPSRGEGGFDGALNLHRDIVIHVHPSRGARDEFGKLEPRPDPRAGLDGAGKANLVEPVVDAHACTLDGPHGFIG